MKVVRVPRPPEDPSLGHSISRKSREGPCLGLSSTCPQQGQGAGWVTHIVGQLEAAHVGDVLTQCVLPIHLPPEGKRKELPGPCWPHTALAALGYGPSPFPREFRRSLLLPSLHMYHMYCVSLLRELGGCSCTRESGACVRVRVCVHEQARMLPVCGQLKGAPRTSREGLTRWL